MLSAYIHTYIPHHIYSDKSLNNSYGCTRTELYTQPPLLYPLFPSLLYNLHVILYSTRKKVTEHPSRSCVCMYIERGCTCLGLLSTSLCQLPGRKIPNKQKKKKKKAHPV